MVYYSHIEDIWTAYANVRFDTKIKEDIEYHTDSQSFNASLLSHIPDPSLGYLDQTTGSDVLDVIEDYLNNSPFSLCGSYIFLLAKRYPSNVPYDDKFNKMLQKLRDNHASVYIVTSNTPSGGSDITSLFDLAMLTNGFGVSNSDAPMKTDIYYTSRILLRPYQFLAQIFDVSGAGRKEIQFQAANTGPYWQQVSFYITYQNHNRDENFKKANYTVTDTYGNDIADGPFVTTASTKSTLNSDYPILNRTADYTLAIDYTYGSNMDRMLVRMYRDIPTDDWLPIP